MQHTARATPARFRLHDSDLACDVVRGHCYRGRCACGWVGPRRDSYSLAREDAKDHRAEMQLCEAGEATGGTEAS